MSSIEPTFASQNTKTARLSSEDVIAWIFNGLLIGLGVVAAATVFI